MSRGSTARGAQFYFFFAISVFLFLHASSILGGSRPRAASWRGGTPTAPTPSHSGCHPGILRAPAAGSGSGGCGGGRSCRRKTPPLYYFVRGGSSRGGASERARHPTVACGCVSRGCSGESSRWWQSRTPARRTRSPASAASQHSSRAPIRPTLQGGQRGFLMARASREGQLGWG